MQVITQTPQNLIIFTGFILIVGIIIGMEYMSRKIAKTNRNNFGIGH